MRKSSGMIMAASASAALALVTGCSDSGSSGDASPSSESSAMTDTTSAPAGTESPSSTQQSTAGGTDIIENPPAKSWSDALEAARKEFPGNPIKIELETRDGGGLEYKLELVTDAAEFEVQFDAETLQKLSSEEDQVGDDVAKDRLKMVDTNDIVALEDAATTARSEQDGAITSWKLEGNQDGIIKYEFDILPEGSSDDVEVSINAKDGSVIAGS